RDGLRAGLGQAGSARAVAQVEGAGARRVAGRDVAEASDAVHSPHPIGDGIRMSDHVWIRVTTAVNIPEREGRAVRIGARDIAIFNLGDRFLATDNQCPHQGGPLCDGIVTGSSVVCPLHAWKVNLTSGAVERPASNAACITTYPTRVDDGIVWLRL